MATDAAAIAEVLGGSGVLGEPVDSLADLEHAVRAGLPKQAVQSLARHVSGDARRRRAVIHSIVPEASYKRRRTRLSPAESERAERLARVVAAAREVFGEGPDLEAFLSTPHPELEDRTPLEAARSGVGARRVEGILAAITWGLPV